MHDEAFLLDELPSILREKILAAIKQLGACSLRMRLLPFQVAGTSQMLFSWKNKCQKPSFAEKALVRNVLEKNFNPKSGANEVYYVQKNTVHKKH